MERKVLGLKIGINSIAFNLVHKTEESITPLVSGMRLFSSPENPKTHESFKSIRSDRKRNQSRIKRNKKRLQKIKNILNLFIERNGLASISPGIESGIKVWKWRRDAFHNFLHPYELYQVIYHMAKNRGYKAHLKEENEDKTGLNGKVNEALNANENQLKNYNSCADFLSSRPTFRNKRGEYNNSLKRDWLRNDFKKIMEVQSKLYATHTGMNNTPTFIFFTGEEISQLESIIYDQNFLKNKLNEIGECTLIPSHKRLARSHPLADEFLFLSKITTGKWFNPENNIAYELNSKLLADCYHHYKTTGKFTVTNFKKVLKLEKKEKLVNPIINEAVIHSSPSVTKIANILPDLENQYTHEQIELLIQYLVFVYDPKEKEEKLKEIEIKENDITTLVDLRLPGGTIKYSRAALEILLPFMRKGLDYKDSIEHARFHQLLPMEAQNASYKFLPPFPLLNSQVINRAASISRKVINEIIREYGDITDIHLEIGTELGKTAEARRKILKLNRHLYKTNEEAREFLDKHKFKITAENIEIYKVWKSQGEKDVLTNESITLQEIHKGEARLIVINEASLTRNFQNLLLVHTKNIDHLNLLLQKLIETFVENPEGHPYLFESKVKNIQARLQQGHSTELSLIPCHNWMLKHISNHISSNMSQLNVYTFPKQLIRYLKNNHLTWFADLKSQSNFDPKLINLMDAILLSHLDKSTLSLVEKYLERETHNPLSINLKMDKEGVLKILNNYQPEIHPNRKLSGQAHLDTRLRLIPSSLKNISSGERIIFPKKRELIRNNPIKTYLLKRIPLTSITPSNIDLIQNYENFPYLKQQLLKRLDQYNWDAKKAFEKPLKVKFVKKVKKTVASPTGKIKYKQNLYSVLIYDDSRSVVALKRAAVNYGDLICTNIYKHEGKYLGSPIYAMDILRLKTKKQQNEDCIFPKTFINSNGEMLLDAKAKFMCRLFYGDYIELVYPVVIGKLEDGKKTQKVIKGYYSTYNRSTNSIILINGTEINYRWVPVGNEEICEVISPNIIHPSISLGIGKIQDIKRKHVSILGKKYDSKQKEIMLIN